MKEKEEKREDARGSRYRIGARNGGMMGLRLRRTLKVRLKCRKERERGGDRMCLVVRVASNSFPSAWEREGLGADSDGPLIFTSNTDALLSLSLFFTLYLKYL